LRRPRHDRGIADLSCSQGISDARPHAAHSRIPAAAGTPAEHRRTSCAQQSRATAGSASHTSGAESSAPEQPPGEPAAPLRRMRLRTVPGIRNRMDRTIPRYHRLLPMRQTVSSASRLMPP
jgi:hypothetical protein